MKAHLLALRPPVRAQNRSQSDSYQPQRFVLKLRKHHLSNPQVVLALNQKSRTLLKDWNIVKRISMNASPQRA